MANVEFFGLIYSIVLLIFTTRVLRRELSASVTLVTLSEFSYFKRIYFKLVSKVNLSATGFSDEYFWS